MKKAYEKMFEKLPSPNNVPVKVSQLSVNQLRKLQMQRYLFSYTKCKHFEYELLDKLNFTRSCEIQHNQNAVDMRQKVFLTARALEEQVASHYTADQDGATDAFRASLYQNAQQVRQDFDNPEVTLV